MTSRSSVAVSVNFATHALKPGTMLKKRSRDPALSRNRLTLRQGSLRRAAPICLILSSEALLGAAHAVAQQPTSADTLSNAPVWRLLHIQQPSTGAVLPALSAVAEPDGSDARLVGMTIRCGVKPDESALVSLFIIADPLPPRTKPQVTLHVGEEDLVLAAQIIPTGAGICLLLDMREKILGPWCGATDLRVTIKSDVTTIKGVIRLAGLFEGLNRLAAECSRN